MYCMKCGQQLPDDAAFCFACGAPTNAATNIGANGSGNTATTNRTPLQTAEPEGLPNIRVTKENCDRITYRVKCDACGEAMNVKGLTWRCSKCGKMHQYNFEDYGFIHLYRMGNALNLNAMEVYLNQVPYGKVANAASCVIAVKPGRYLMHTPMGMNRRVEQLAVEVRAGGTALVKAAHVGFAFGAGVKVLACSPMEMPSIPLA